jgi:hypothetical protein
MRYLGIDRSRIKFEAARSVAQPDDAIWIDAYNSTLSVPQAIYDRIVAPGVLC